MVFGQDYNQDRNGTLHTGNMRNKLLPFLFALALENSFHYHCAFPRFNDIFDILPNRTKGEINMKPQSKTPEEKAKDFADGCDTGQPQIVEAYSIYCQTEQKEKST